MMKPPHPPVSAMFTIDGLLLHVIEKDKLYQKTLSWRDLYKIGKKGKKMTPTGMVKTVTNKFDDLIKQHTDSNVRSQKLLDDMKKFRETRPVVSAVPVMPPPVMPPPPPPSATGT